MSTKLTKKSPIAGFELVDSKALILTQLSGGFRDRMVNWLLSQLKEDGFKTLKANQLTFLGTLDCGVNYAAELARLLGVSRQAIHKTLRELEHAGWLETKPDEVHGNQRVIVFTAEGERMMAQARAHFLKLDQLLAAQFSAQELANLEKLLEFDPFAIAEY